MGLVSYLGKTPVLIENTVGVLLHWLFFHVFGNSGRAVGQQKFLFSIIYKSERKRQMTIFP